ncbi:MAG: glycosyltransferase family 4 protein [Muribaculaceae bacterium]|nr:glycosyltransferase family 4 protein [Muribaculaceae bacterium]
MRSLVHIVNGNMMAGAQQYALDICRHYKEQGCNVVALTKGAHAIDSKFSAAGIKVAHAPLRGFLDCTSVIRVARFIRTLPKGEVIFHAHRYRDAYTAMLARWLAKRPDVKIVATRHAVRKGRDSGIFRKLYSNIDAHIFVSRLAYERFCRSWEGKNIPLSDDKVFVLHNSLYIPLLPSPLPEPEKGPVTAIYHGPIAEGKGLETLIDALMSMRNVKMRLLIAGNGSPDFLDRLRKRAMIREVMDAIDWNTNCDDPSALIAKAHFGVVPSIESEAFGMGNLRYMALGRPQVCTYNGAQTEYLRDGATAFLVPPADTATLSEAMTRLARSAELRLRMGAEAQKDFNANLAWDSFTRKLDDIYDKCFRPT